MAYLTREALLRIGRERDAREKDFAARLRLCARDLKLDRQGKDQGRKADIYYSEPSGRVHLDINPLPGVVSDYAASAWKNCFEAVMGVKRVTMDRGATPWGEMRMPDNWQALKLDDLTKAIDKVGGKQNLGMDFDSTESPSEPTKYSGATLSGDYSTGKTSSGAPYGFSKPRFKRDALRYMNEVVGHLSRLGYEPHRDREGNPDEPVTDTEGRTSGSGSVYLDMIHPRGYSVHAITNSHETGHREVDNKHPQHIVLGYQHSPTGMRLAYGGTGRWVDWDTPSDKLASMLHSEASGEYLNKAIDKRGGGQNLGMNFDDDPFEHLRQAERDPLAPDVVPASRPAHHISRDEYLRSQGHDPAEANSQRPFAPASVAAADHESKVADALASGQDIPDHVMADYPNLRQKLGMDSGATTSTMPSAANLPDIGKTPSLDHETYDGPRYTYGLQLRPPGPGAIPRGFIVGSHRAHSDPSDYRARHGVIDYPHPLSAQEANHFDMHLLGQPEQEKPEDPWRMTRSEYLAHKLGRDSQGFLRGTPDAHQRLSDEHERHVVNAVNRNEIVPGHVAAEYKDALVKDAENRAIEHGKNRLERNFGLSRDAISAIPGHVLSQFGLDDHHRTPELLSSRRKALLAMRNRVPSKSLDTWSGLDKQLGQVEESLHHTGRLDEEDFQSADLGHRRRQSQGLAGMTADEKRGVRVLSINHGLTPEKIREIPRDVLAQYGTRGDLASKDTLMTRRDHLVRQHTKLGKQKGANRDSEGFEKLDHELGGVERHLVGLGHISPHQVKSIEYYNSMHWGKEPGLWAGYDDNGEQKKIPHSWERPAPAPTKSEQAAPKNDVASPSASGYTPPSGDSLFGDLAPAPAPRASQAQKPARVVKPTGKVMLGDYGGNEFLDGDNIPGTPKGNFLKDGRAYLSDVAAKLSAKGYRAATDRKGKQFKTVSVNPSGSGTSGDVTLHMKHPDGHSVYASVVSGHAIPGVKRTRHSIAIMGRSDRSGSDYATGGMNRWVNHDTPSDQFAEALHGTVEGQHSPLFKGALYSLPSFIMLVKAIDKRGGKQNLGLDFESYHPSGLSLQEYMESKGKMGDPLRSVSSNGFYPGYREGGSFQIPLGFISPAIDMIGKHGLQYLHKQNRIMPRKIGDAISDETEAKIREHFGQFGIGLTRQSSSSLVPHTPDYKVWPALYHYEAKMGLSKAIDKIGGKQNMGMDFDAPHQQRETRNGKLDDETQQIKEGLAKYPHQAAFLDKVTHIGATNQPGTPAPNQPMRKLLDWTLNKSGAVEHKDLPDGAWHDYQGNVAPHIFRQIHSFFINHPDAKETSSADRRGWTVEHGPHHLKVTFGTTRGSANNLRVTHTDFTPSWKRWLEADIKKPG